MYDRRDVDRPAGEELVAAAVVVVGPLYRHPVIGNPVAVTTTTSETARRNNPTTTE
jgi:hypothetical protein